MVLTDLLLMFCIAALLLFAIYHDVVLPRRKGVTLLRVALRRRHLPDSAIFIGLLLILLWKNISNAGPVLTTTLIMVLCALTLWVFWLRRPVLLMKQEGLFDNGIWIRYARIAAIDLSPEGVLLMQLERRRLLIAVHTLDDLERICHTLLIAR